MTSWGGVLSLGFLGGDMVALTTRTLVRRGFTPRLGLSARQRFWPAVLSDWQVGLRRHFYDCVRSIALKEPPSSSSTLQSHGSSLFGFPPSTALSLIPWCRATLGEVEAPTSDARSFVSTVKVRMAEALAAPTLQRTFGDTYDPTDIRKLRSTESYRILDTSDPRATDIMI